MIGDKVGVMVSSTYYDLKQVRADLRQFIEDELGYRALLFEDGAFPIDPDSSTIENCKARVEHNVDVFVLIIGTRYGYVDGKSGKSVTNLEYSTARTKGIPIYVFIEPAILNYLRLWKASPNSDYSTVVDNPQIFEFVDSIRSQDGVWTCEFSAARDIIDRLRTQFAYLFHDSLRMRRRISGHPEREVLQLLSGKCLRLAVEKPEAWEYLLFASALQDEISRYAIARLEHRTDLALGFGRSVALRQFHGFFREKLHEITQMVAYLMRISNHELQAAFGPPGQSGSVRDIVAVARLIGNTYLAAIEWSNSIRRCRFHPAAKQAAIELSRGTNALLDSLEQFGPDIEQQITSHLAARRVGSAPTTLAISLDITLSNSEAFSAAMDELQRKLLSHEVAIDDDDTWE